MKTYSVCVSTGKSHKDGTIKYGYLDVKGRSEWKTKRIAEKHAREYNSTFLRDSWVEEN